MSFYPHFPIHLNPIALFGVTLLLGLLSGEAITKTRILPRITGYILIGFIVGPSILNLTTKSLLNNANFFVEIALGLILFDLGRHLDFRWLKQDAYLLLMSVTESLLTFTLIFTLLCYFQFHLLDSAIAATIAMATSPAVVMMVSHDLSSEGPITRRCMILTSLNNLLAITLFTILLPLTFLQTTTTSLISGYILYRLFGSIILGFIMFLIMQLMARFTGKHRETQFILFMSIISLSIGLTINFNLSTMLTLLILGIAARNLDFRHALTEVDFGWLARLFIILLFVVTGVYLKPSGLWLSTLPVILFIAIKTSAKMIGIYLFKRPTRLTTRQAIALGLTLMPMAELAVGMSNQLVYVNPSFNHDLIRIITASAAILYFIGPIAMQLALLQTNEGVTNTSKQGDRS